MVAVRHKIHKRVKPDEPNCIVQRMYLKPVNQHGVIKCFFHRRIAVYMQHPLRMMSKMFMPVYQLNGEKMIHVGMRDQKMLDLPQPQGMAEGMCVGVWRKIKQDLAVHKGLCPGAHLLPADISCPSASFAVTEQGR